MKFKNINPTIAVLIFFLFASISGCVVFSYLWIDRSITLSYVTEGLEVNKNAIDNLKLIVELQWQDMPKSEVLKKLTKLQQNYPETNFILKQDQDGSLWFEDINFVFQSDRLEKIVR